MAWRIRRTDLTCLCGSSQRFCGSREMKRVFIFVPFIALVLAGFCCATFAQETWAELGGNREASRSGLTGAGTESRTTAAKSGGADGQGNPMLGDRHPLYRLRASDGVYFTF